MAGNRFGKIEVSQIISNTENFYARDPVRGLDSVNATLPTTATTLDGLTPVTGDRFLFTNLSSNNNTVQKVTTGSTPTTFATYPINTGSTLRVWSGTVFRWAVSFVPSSSASLTTVSWGLLRLGTPGGNAFATIYSYSGGLPNTLLGTSDNVPISSITTSAALNTFTFSTPVSLTGGVTYFAVINVDGGYTYSAGVNYLASLDATGSPIGGVTNAFYNGTWSSYPQTETATISGTVTSLSWTLETDGPNSGIATNGSTLYIQAGTNYAKQIKVFDGTSWVNRQYQDLIPTVNNVSNLGSASLSFSNSYLYNENLKGTTSGTLTLKASATTTSHTLTFPAAQGAANTVLTNNGSGTLAWSLGLVPVGSIIAWSGGYFANGSNGTFTNVLANTVANVNTYLSGTGWVVCDGAALNDASSPIFNGASRFLPNLTDSRFLMGSTTSGTIGGQNSTTISSANLPVHTHDMAHTHGAFTSGGMSANTTHSHSITDPGHIHPINVGAGTATGVPYVASGASTSGTANTSVTYTVATGISVNSSASIDHTHSTTISAYAGSTGNGGFANTAVENRPLYLSCFYIIRYK